MLFTEGQHVTQGDVLMRLDPADFDARLRQAEANAARDQAQLAKARPMSTRYLRSRPSFVSDEKVNDIRTAKPPPAPSLRASKAAVDLARLQLGYTTMRAPFDGIVGARLVFPGIASRSTTRRWPWSIASGRCSSVSPCPRNTCRACAPHGNATGKWRHEVDVSLPGDRTQHLEGEIRFLDNAVDTTTGTIQMKAVLANDGRKAHAGTVRQRLAAARYPGQSGHRTRRSHPAGPERQFRLRRQGRQTASRCAR